MQQKRYFDTICTITLCTLIYDVLFVFLIIDQSDNEGDNGGDNDNANNSQSENQDNAAPSSPERSKT